MLGWGISPDPAFTVPSKLWTALALHKALTALDQVPHQILQETAAEITYQFQSHQRPDLFYRMCRPDPKSAHRLFSSLTEQDLARRTHVNETTLFDQYQMHMLYIIKNGRLLAKDRVNRLVAVRRNISP